MYVPGQLVFTIGVMIMSFGIGRARQHKLRENDGMWEVGIGITLALSSSFMKW